MLTANAWNHKVQQTGCHPLFDDHKSLQQQRAIFPEAAIDLKSRVFTMISVTLPKML